MQVGGYENRVSLLQPRLDLDLTTAVSMLDSITHGVNHFPQDKSVGFSSTRPMDWDLSPGWYEPDFELLGTVVS